MPTSVTRKPKQLFPLGDKVVVIPAPKKDRSDGGILLPEDAQRLPKHGKVFAVGPDVPERIQPGMNVLFAQYAGHELEIDDGENEPLTVLIMGFKSLDAEIK